MRDEAGADAARFVVTNAWPVKYDPSDLNAKGNEVMIELLELANEGIEEEELAIIISAQPGGIPRRLLASRMPTFSQLISIRF